MAISDYFRKYDESNDLSVDYDDRQRLLQTNTTGNSVLKEIVKGDPIRGVIKLVNTAKKFSINSELSNILNGESTKKLDSFVGRLANTDNYKFQYGINDNVVDRIDLYKNFVDKIEDPTILTFTVEIDENSSPLFITGAGGLRDFLDIRRVQFPASGEVSLEAENTIVNSQIGGLYDNHSVLWE